jgi:TatD DNase family protein
MTTLTDIGVNLMGPAFDSDREAVLESAQTAGVCPIVITGNDIASSAAALAFARSRTGGECYATVGVHPHNAKTWDATALAALRKLISESATPHVLAAVGVAAVGVAAVGVAAVGPAAIGECGLDYNRNFSPPEAQRKCFEDQLALAAELGKPVFLHERDAFGDFFTLLKKYRPSLPGAVVHCFTGGEAELEACLSVDCYIGITGWICDERRGGHLIPLLPKIPADRLLLETDAPYLLPRNLPRSMKGKSGRNEPRFLPHIAAFAAEILDKPYDQLASETSAKAARFFNFDRD